MADISVNGVKRVEGVQVAEGSAPATVAPAPKAAPVAASQYEGVRSGRKVANPTLQLQQPGIKGSSKPAMTDGLGPGWDNIM